MTGASNPDLSSSPIAAGTVLAGKYRVDRVLGQGGMGVVVEAHHVALDERVALKFLLPEYAQHPEAAARFLREARAAVKIKGEHVARVSDVGTMDDGAPYMVMEYLEGSDLSKVLETSGVLAVPDAVDFLIQGCDAIAEAHAQGIVHRDLKPANLFLTKRPDGTPLVKVLDFGISKTAGNVDNLTRTTAAMGSALYMSPEQMQQTRGVDHRTDVYALGIALFELLGGKQPYYAESLPQLCAEILTGTPTPLATLRPDIPHELCRIIEKAYARERADRYQSVSEFALALSAFAPSRSQPLLDRLRRMAGLPSLMPPAGPRPQAARTPAGTEMLHAAARTADAASTDAALSKTGSGEQASPKRSLVVAAIGAVVFVGVAAGAFMMLRGRPSDSATVAHPDTASASVAAPALPSVVALPPPVPEVTPVPSIPPVPTSAVTTIAAGAEPIDSRPRKPRARPSSPSPATPTPSAKPAAPPAAPPPATPPAPKRDIFDGR